jgi:asparagine synthase (glutamine-hydrolysing)
MCGIAGIISRESRSLESLVSMARLLRHRGPDDEGFLVLEGESPTPLAGEESHPSSIARHSLKDCKIEKFSFEGVSLGMAHRRLSIIDLSANGHQPMSRNNKVWITYNGEVYNYLEIRNELEGQGVSFSTDSDTEVVLAAYERWGVESFSRLNGMWAMAILDLNSRKIILSRDRFGIKPLYLYAEEQSLSFASEIKAFKALPNWNPRANEGAIHEFLFNSLSDHTEKTFFKDVNQLLPGHFVSIDIDRTVHSLQGIKQERWYDLPIDSPEVSFEKGIDPFKALFLDSVRIRMRSDVQFGSCLSGGLDSSSIVGAMRELSAESQISTITSCSIHKEFDESFFADQVVDFTNAKSAKVFPDPNSLSKKIDDIIWHQDEPFGSASIYAQWCVFEKARDLGIPVMLDGQGADETHCGYNSFLRPYVSGQLRTCNFLSLWRNLKLLRPSTRKAAGSFLRGLLDLSTPTPLGNYFSSLKEEKRMKGWYFGRERLPSSSSMARQYNLRDHSAYMMNTGMRMLLHWEDRNSMAHSVESRVPFLDYRLMPFLFSLSDAERVEGGWSKSIIRKSMCGLLPDEVIHRQDKMGFVTPESIWAKNECRELYLRDLKELPECWGDLIGPGIAESFGGFLRGEKEYNSIFWKILCLNRWRKIFGVSL